MYQQNKSKLFWFGAITVLTTILWVVFFFLAAHEVEQSAHQVALLKEIKQRTNIIALASRNMMRDPKSLEALQTAHQDNVESFQTLLNGNIKSGVSAMKDLRNRPDQMPAHFDQFSHHVSQLLQKRTTVERLIQDRDAYIQGLDLLVDKAKGIVLGVEAATPTQQQLNAAFAVLATLQQSQVKLTKSYYNKGTLAPLPVSSLSKNLALLSTDEAAPKPGSIRRSAANLMSAIEEHQSKLEAVDEHNRLKVGINELVEQLSVSQQTLEEIINGSLSGVQNDSAIWFYLALFFGVLSIGLGVAAGNQLGLNSRNLSAASSGMGSGSAANGEHTSETERARFKTERNRLINDIRPLSSGILYIKADENLETTGEIARFFNQSREAIAYRIESLRQHAQRLQRQVNDYQHQDESSSIKVNIDTSPVEDLTFRANAELDGLQRRLKALHYSDKEEIKSLIVRCIRAERMLDEIRLRVKKGWAEDLEIKNETNSVGNENGNSHNEQLKSLINEMMLHLNEFKLQAPRPKQGNKTGRKEVTQGYQTPKLKTHTPMPSNS